MTGKRKRRKSKSQRHITARAKGIVTTPLRLAIEAMVVPRLDRLWRWECPSMTEVIGRLASGRAVKVRNWATGQRRAPTWFVAVLDGELARQIEHRQAIREELARYETGDRRRSPEARARGRAARMRQLGRPINEGAAVGGSGIDASPDPAPDTPGPK
jgi:hypothetical protein